MRFGIRSNDSSSVHGRRLVVAILSAAILCVGLGAALAQSASPPTLPAPPSAPPAEPSASPAPREAPPAPLAPKTRKQKIAALPEKYRAWLKEEVNFLVTKDEETVFLALATDAQREKFIEEFWRRRDDFTQSRGYETRRRHYERLQYARSRFETTIDERSRVLILQGIPDVTTKINCSAFWPAEVWEYERLEALRGGAVLLFYRPFGVGKWRLWMPIEGIQSLRNPMSAQEEPNCIDLRSLYKAISFASFQGGRLGGSAALSTLFQPPEVDDEEAADILGMVAEVPENAVRFEVETGIRFPGQRGTKIAAEITLRVPRQGLGVKELNGKSYYNLDVVGEIVRGSELLDNFKYKFDFVAGDLVPAAAEIPLSIQRFARPGEYDLRIKLHDLNADRYALVVRTLQVPDHPEAEASQQTPRAEAAQTVARLSDSLHGPGVIELIPIDQEMTTGRVRFETLVTTAGVDHVSFFLDGKKIATKNVPPFDVELDLGALPRSRTVKVAAYTADGTELDQDSMVLNEGREKFRVRIVEPRTTVRVGAVDVEADIKLPEDRKIESVEFYWSESVAATLYNPPYRQRISIPAAKPVGYIKVVARLTDGSSTEDVMMMNTPGYSESVDVSVVELYTTVTDRRGKPVRGLKREDFIVSEDGVAQNIGTFDYAENLPLTLGVAIDSSGSMELEIADAQKAAAEFLKASLTGKDRAFLVDFDTQPYLLQKTTSDLSLLTAKIAGLRAEGGTALYDAIVFSLFQFQGVRGKRAIVILSDGEDRNSKFDFDTCIDYARKSGVAIYVIGMKITFKMVDVRFKLNRLAAETGGTVYYIDTARNLEQIYRDINTELRSQYLLTYFSSNSRRDDKWRKVQVATVPKNTEARTIAGYYP